MLGRPAANCSPCLEHVPQSGRSLGQNLVGVPVRSLHDVADGLDVVVGHVLVEEVAHRVDEDHFRRLPPQRLRQLFRHEPEVKSLLVRMPGHAPEPLGERLGVAVVAAGRDLGAAADGIPRRVGPFDLGVLAHAYRL